MINVKLLSEKVDLQLVLKDGSCEISLKLNKFSKS